MTLEEKAKAYDEALEKARELKKYLTADAAGWTTVDIIFPQLRENNDEKVMKILSDVFADSGDRFISEYERKQVVSWLEKRKESLISETCKENADFFTDEDERIRKKLIEIVGYFRSRGIDQQLCEEFLAYLEKQKEQKPDIELVQKSWYMEGYHDREFGKEPMWLITACDGGPIYELNPKYGKKLVDEQKPAWSEEDEKRIKQLIYDTEHIRAEYEKRKDELGEYFNDKLIKDCDEQIAWLKDLRPQSKDEIYKDKDKAYKLGKHYLAVKFMNYLDENRPEGKMSLSSGECEDIDKAFKENDWAKIMRYVEKYRPSWKPSEEQMKALAWYSGNCNIPPTGDKTIKSLYNDLKKLYP